MTIVQVPPGATPGKLDNTTLIGLEAICDVGSRAGVKDGSVSAWVEVCIVPHGDVTPDAFGRYLHVCIKFAQPTDWLGKRRRQVPGWATTPDPDAMFVECDPGLFWIGTWAMFYVTGGTPEDRYNVTMTVATSQQESDARLARGDAPFYQVDVFEPACLFELTAQSAAGGVLPGPADHHSKFSLVNDPIGSATRGGIAIRGSRSVPLNAPIVLGGNTIYKTGGGV